MIYFVGIHHKEDLAAFCSSTRSGKKIDSVISKIKDPICRKINLFTKSHLPKKGTKSKSIDMKGRNWNIFYGLPKNKDFYSYEVSIMYIPCTEHVNWLLLKDTVVMNKLSYEKLKKLNLSEQRNPKK